jgi:hypothetical protein
MNIYAGIFISLAVFISGITNILREYSVIHQVDTMDIDKLIIRLNQVTGLDRSQDSWLEAYKRQDHYYKLFGFRPLIPICFSILLFMLGFGSILLLGWHASINENELILPAMTFILVMLPHYFVRSIFFSRAMKKISH